MCCCQANNVDELCLGYCMGQDAEYTEWDTEVTEEDDDEKDETIKFPPFWFLVKKFLSLLQQSFKNMLLIL